MKRISKVVTGTAVLATAAGLVLLGGGVASAATPPWETGPADANDIGTIAFYNSAGTQITGGSLNDSPIAAYAVGSAVTGTAQVNANLKFCTPDSTKAPAAWTCLAPDAFTTYPTTTAPANINTLSQTLPTDTGFSGDVSLGGYAAAIPETDSTAGYLNVYQIRLETSNAGGTQSAKYDSADLLVNNTAGTYTIEYGTAFGTTTTLSATPNPTNVGVSVTLTATETAIDGTHPAGSVQFFQGATSLGTDAVNGSGVATQATTALPLGTDPISAVFTPTTLTAYSASTGTSSVTVDAPATPTHTALSVGGSTQFTGTDVSLTATVTPAGTPGTVTFTDNGTTVLGAETVPTSTSGAGDVYTLDEPTGLPVGGHSVVASFVPTDTGAFESSASSASSFTTSAPLAGACTQPLSQCTDTQNIQAEIPVGTLVISTPYTALHPLDLGNLVLQANATEYLGSAPFTNIQVTDTRSGNLGWTISALSSDLTDGGSNPNSTIDSQNIGLTALTGAASNGFVGTVTPSDNPAAGHDPVAGPFAVAPGAPLQAAGQQGLGINAHTVAVAAVGDTPGTYTLNGTLTITAPTSTEAGTFTGTILFTVG